MPAHEHIADTRRGDGDGGPAIKYKGRGENTLGSEKPWMSKHLPPSYVGGTDVHSLLKQCGCERGWWWHGGTKYAKHSPCELQILPGDRGDMWGMSCHITPHTDAVSTGHQLASRKDSRGNTSTTVESAGFRDKFFSLPLCIFYDIMKRNSESNGAPRERITSFRTYLFTPSLALRYDFTPCTPTQRVTTQRLCPL